MEILKFFEDLTVESLPSLEGCSEYMLIIIDGRIFGAVADPLDMPGFEIGIRAARETAAELGYKSISFLIVTTPIAAQQE